MKKNLKKKLLSFLLTASMFTLPIASIFVGAEEVYAQENTVSVGAGSYSKEAKGTWSYVANGQTIQQTNKSLLEKLPYEGRV